MADTDLKISGCPAADALAGSELVPVVQNGSNKRATVSQIRAGMASAAQGTKADNALPADLPTVRAKIGAVAADATQGPLLGAAQAVADVSQSAANLLAQWDAVLAKMGYRAALQPASDTVNVGGLMTWGDLVPGRSNVYTVDVIDIEGLIETPFAGILTDENGLAAGIPYDTGQFYDTVMSGAPYAPRTVSPVSNVLTFDARYSGDGRNIHVPALAANLTVSPLCWLYILDTDPSPVRLHVAIGGTARTVTPTAGNDGLVVNAFPTFGTNTIQVFELSRANGRPQMLWVAELIATAAEPSFVAAKANPGLTVTSDWTLDLPVGTRVGDSVAVFIGTSGATMAPNPTIAGSAFTDSGLTGDGNAPTVRLCWKTNLTAAEIAEGYISGAAGANQVYAATFRKPGAFPTFALPIVYETPATSTATLTWAAQAFAQDCLYLGFVMCQSDDSAPVRSPGVVVAERATGNSRSSMAVSALLKYGVDSLGATTTAKTGIAGRAACLSVVVY